MPPDPIVFPILVFGLGAVVWLWGKAPDGLRAWLPALGGLLVIFSGLLLATDLVRLVLGR